MGEQRKTDANRHGARGLRKLREARAKKPTNFVPGDVDRAREDDVESMQKRRRYIFSEKTMGEWRKKGRKERRSRWRGRSARGRRVYPRVTAIDLMRKMLGAAQKSTPGGKVAYIPGSSLRLFRPRERASLRRPRSRSLSSSSFSSFFSTSAAPYSLFVLHHRRCSTVFRYRYRVLLRELTFSEFRSIKPRGRSSGDLSKAREKPDVLSQGKEDPSSRAFPDFPIISTLSRGPLYSS